MFRKKKAVIDVSKQIRQRNLELGLLSNKTGMPITENKFQRRYGPPVDSFKAPPKGSEVFVGRLPTECLETEIVPLFETVGRIYEIQMMTSFNGNNRGFCFVTFYTPEVAAVAIEKLNGFEIRPGRCIAVCKTMNNCRLFIGGIPKNKSREEIFEEISGITHDVVKVIIYKSTFNRSRNLGFAFVEYRSHKAASMAQRKMTRRRTQMWGKDVDVEWAKQDEPDAKTLYIRNLFQSTTQETILNIFNAASNKGVERIRKKKDYAFVHLVTREIAEQVKMQLDRMKIDGAEVEILWAKHADKYLKLGEKDFSPSLQSPSSFDGVSTSYANESACCDQNDNSFSPHNVTNNNQMMMEYPGYPTGYYFCLPVGQVQPFSHNLVPFQHPGVEIFQEPLPGGNFGVPSTILPLCCSAPLNANCFDASPILEFQPSNLGLEYCQSGSLGEMFAMPISTPNQLPLIIHPSNQNMMM